jgi:hypothetical protein
MVTRVVPVILIALLLHGAPATAQDGSAPADSLDLIVLPFANYTGRYEALGSVLPVFYSELESRGFRVVSHEELRPILREHRVRVVGEISRAAMEILAGDTGARLAVVGSIDVYEPGGSFEVMISARVVDLLEGSVLTAVSVGRTVQETERAFGVGRAQEIEEIVELVVTDFVGQINPVLDEGGRTRKRYHKCGLVAVIPMDDFSRRRHGAKVLEHLLMAELVARDWTVVEPGVIRESLLDHQSMARGGVSYEVLSMLRDETGICFAITGEVSEFSVTATGIAASVPRLEYGVRLIDAREHRLVDSIDRARDGRDAETVFERGREYSIARLARSSIIELLDELEGRGGL